MQASTFRRRWHFAAICAAAVVALAGCATGPREVATEVHTYARMDGVQLPATYRMELLPSQSQQASFARIEAAAEQSLRRVGLVRDPRPDLARLVVQVGASSYQGRARHPAYDHYGPRPSFGWGIGYGGRGGWGGGVGFGMGMMLDTPPMVYNRAVKLVLRDPASQQIVYETSAEYDEVWMDDQLIWGLLFDAALSGFPHPPQGARQVRSTVESLPSTTSAAPKTSAPATAAP